MSFDVLIHFHFKIMNITTLVKDVISTYMICMKL